MSRRALLGALALALAQSTTAAAAEFGGSRSIYLGPQWPVAQALNSQLGLDVALSDTRAAVGAPYGEATTGSDLGAVLLFDIGDDSFSAQVEVFGPAAGIRFGSRVALEGDVLAVSAFGNDAVYIYRDVDDVWTIEAGLTQALFPRFGRALDLSPDGETLLVGAIYPAARGRVFVYRHNAGTWTADTPPLVAPPVGGHFGAALSRAGDRVAIGSPVEDPQGAVYFAREVDDVFTLDPTPLLPSGAPAVLEFGSALALTDDGLLAVGAPGSDGDAGAVLVYRDDGVNWDLLAIHTPSQGLAPRFGQSVAFAEGALIVGAPAEGSGVAYVINDPGVADGPPWLVLDDDFLVEGNLLGVSVATRGRRVLVGAPATMAGIDGDAKAYELLYAQGSPCVLDTECTKGACVDGVCCSGPCDGPCERCSTQAGAEEDGICGPLLCPGEQICVEADDACGDAGATETGTGTASSTGTSATSGGQVGLEPWEGGCACGLADDRAPRGGALALLVLSVGLGLRRRASPA